MKICLNCKGNVKRHGKGVKYCSNACQIAYQNSIYIQNWLDGKECGHVGKTIQLSTTIRKWLKDTRGSACESCGWDGKHPIDLKSLTEIDHIDGDATNNTPSNLKILCPNCHSMTPTFRARNKNSKRVR